MPTDDLIDRVLLSPRTIERWHDACRTVSAILHSRDMQPQHVGTERATLLPDGTLRIWVPSRIDGTELIGIVVPVGEWDFRPQIAGSN